MQFRAGSVKLYALFAGPGARYGEIATYL